MTFEEVAIAIHYINIRDHNNYALQASLHGHKIGFKSARPKKNTDFSMAETDAADRAMKKIVARGTLRKK